MKVQIIEGLGYETDRRILEFQPDIDARYVILEILGPKGDTLVLRVALRRDELAAVGRTFAEPLSSQTP